MYRTITSVVLLGVCGLGPAVAVADSVTGVTGGDQPFSNMQPSLALNYFVPLEGIYPSRDGGGGSGMTLGNVRLFAGTFAPGGSPFADGRLLSIAQNTAVFSLLGTTYGGDGITTFAMPDLRGATAVHAGSGPWLLGQEEGTQDVTLTQAQMPAHTHTLPPAYSGATGSTGGSQPFSNIQPSLGLNYVIAMNGIFPPRDGGGTGGETFLGQVSLFAGNFAPGGWAFAEGQLLSIAQNTALFSLLGTTYGGDGKTTFALPDLRGRTVIGAGSGPWSPGQTTGTEQVTLTQAQMPAHNHTLPPSSDTTDSSGGSQPFSNMQPSMAMNYIIATQGIFPSRGGGIGPETVLGEVTLFAGDFAPAGWAFANGQLLSIAQNTALFSLMGTTYGGDGKTTFALPDLRGRTVIGNGLDPWNLGQFLGNEDLTLTQAQLPAHVHTVPDIPEPATVALLAAGFLGTASMTMRQPKQVRFV